MKGVRTVVPLKEIDEVGEIRWGPWDEHDAADEAMESTQYSSWWDIGTRGEEIWQLRQLNPRRKTTTHSPSSAFAQIVLSRWVPRDGDEPGARTFEEVWVINVQLTKEELAQIQPNPPGWLCVTTSNTTNAEEERPSAHDMLIGKTRDIYFQFLKNPYSVLTQIAL